MPHIDTIVGFVADELRRRDPSRPDDEAIEDARIAVAAVRRFDLQHSYEPLNGRAWRPASQVGDRHAQP